MISLIEDIAKEIINIFFCVIVAWFLFWTGELLVTIISLGYHKPRWKGYSGEGGLKLASKEIISGSIGFCFWLAIFPLCRFFVVTT